MRGARSKGEGEKARHNVLQEGSAGETRRRCLLARAGRGAAWCSASIESCDIVPLAHGHLRWRHGQCTHLMVPG